MPNRIFNRFAMLLMAAALMAQMGCATLSADATNEQRFFEVKAQWNTVLGGAIIFAHSPLGQERPEAIRKIYAVAYRVQGVLMELDITMCFVGVPTELDPAPPADDTCVPLGEAEASRRFDFVTRVLLVAIPELQALTASE